MVIIMLPARATSQNWQNPEPSGPSLDIFRRPMRHFGHHSRTFCQNITLSSSVLDPYTNLLRLTTQTLSSMLGATAHSRWNPLKAGSQPKRMRPTKPPPAFLLFSAVKPALMRPLTRLKLAFH